MTEVQDQYEAYPYPERDPKDEKKRLITGSPSHPVEMDHFLWGGKRDWSQPLRVLVAGGGTGDGLIQIAAVMAAAGKPYQITYLDLSRAARAIAEERAAVRGLTGITFVTDSLLNAAQYGPFDYIDCCGVLHHLPEPQQGFDALSAALAPEGGIGLMVYAPYGRSGVYPLQDAFGALLAGMTPQDRLAAARKVFKRLPKGHPFAVNPHLVDHKASDAGFYDLLLHSQDRPFTVTDLAGALEAAGLDLVNFAQPALYDLARLLPEDVTAPDGLDRIGHMAVAEELRGTIKVHVAYAVKAGRGAQVQARPADMTLVPHLIGVPPGPLAQQISKTGTAPIRSGDEKFPEPLAKSCAPLIAMIDGRRSLAQIAAGARLDHFAFAPQWRAIDRVLGDWGLLRYARISD